MAMDHQPPGLLRRIALPLGALLGVAMAATATVVVLGQARGPECSADLPLKVAVAPAAQQVVTQVAEDFTKAQPVIADRCVHVSVEPRESSDVAGELPTARINPPALWVADSSVWAQRAAASAAGEQTGAPRVQVGASLASTPLVVGAVESTAQRLGWAEAPMSWRQLVDGSVPVAASDPTTTTEGLLGLALVRSMFGDGPQGTPPPELVAALLRVRDNTVSSVREAASKAQTAGVDNSPVIITTEQFVLAQNQAAGTRRMLAGYPAEGSTALDFPLIRVTRENEPPGTAEAVAAFERELRSERTAQRFTDAGFRNAGGKPAPGWTLERDGVDPRVEASLPQPTPEQVEALLKAWASVNQDTRMLAVLDVSGSMEGRAAGGKTRIELARDAAVTALGMLPDTSQIGLWAFSTQQAPPNDWRELVSLGPLGGQLDNGRTRRQALAEGVGSLPGLVRGGTALYDTALAASRAARQGYDPSKANAVVLITDGRDEDPQGISLADLLNTLRSEAAQAQPVPFITIGLGPDADMDALNQIATATGGKAYQARQPEDIRSVLLDAISQRQCRPHC
ncbi:substrate-binding domain-containing protein [Goodfellowiella coeruleoviolacea]|uniref:von Willebrand factor type A domain-containing protein n=1 Tax=Goodfellowiella coeruleoviolacea TaxID=334858 RepID=A0AAE3GC32_9PSEU|nr:substrate-binding domain-containing protein [Goodfellowiella coeruleoviolacea]MCP2164670.1 von Willebrand factor type A domain-containing protein [Goodfellowiella coeruleoviolacea]